MKKPLVIFGIGKIAEVICYYATKECGFEIAGFCVDKGYVNGKDFQGLPVHSFESIEAIYPPDRYDMFVAVGYHNLNKLRETKCTEALNKGYQLVSIVSPGSRIPGNIEYGWNCFIMPPSLIHPCVKLGNNVFIFSGAMVAHHSVIGDNCWLTSCCNISGNVQVGANTFVAVNATVGHNVKIGKECFLGANTLVIKDIEDQRVVIAESSKPIKLNSSQFLRMSGFSSL